MVRRAVQAVSALVQNAWLAFPWTGNIYQGGAKKFCAPGLNCHSCPAAVFACPIGTLQHFLAGARGAVRFATYQLGFYALGLMMLVGAIGGRFACGWLCPFGFLQELLHKIPSPKFRLPKALGHLRYLVFALLVVGLPLALSRAVHPGDAWFCKLLCPAGTLEAGGLLTIMPELRQQIGPVFMLKISVLLLTLVMAVFAFRPWCRTLCPLGLIYGLFNRISVIGVSFDAGKCRDCGKCVQFCKVGLDPRRSDAAPECLRCLGCARRACANGALKVRVGEGGTNSSGDKENILD